MTVQEWLGRDNQLGIDIWNRKYRYNNESFDEWLDRVSGGDLEVKELIKQKKFLFGGRILSNRGLNKDGVKVTYSNCFVAGSMVITSNGLKPIESVNVGDMVLSEDGKYHKVNEVMKRNYSGDMVKICSNALYEPIICTPNHQFLTNRGWLRADRILPPTCYRGKYGSDRLKASCLAGECDWSNHRNEEIIDLTEGLTLPSTKRIKCIDKKVTIQSYHSCSSNKMKSDKKFDWYDIPASEVNRYVKFDDEFAYFVGRWLGDGSITKRKGNDNHSIFQIVFNREKEEDAFQRCKKIGEEKFGISASVRYTNQNIIALRFESEIIASWFFRTFGEKCDGKYVPDKYVGNYNMLLGLFDADGFLDTHGGFKIVLKNYNLISWARKTCYLNNINASEIKSINYRQEDSYEMYIPVSQANRKMTSDMMKTFHDKKNNSLNKSVGEYVNISSIDILENMDTAVYNLSVEDVHSYTVNGVIVHNCYVISPPEDNIESIFECASKLARTYSYGGGCGIDISNLSPKGAKVNNTAKETSGAVSFMDLYSLITGLIGQNGRRGALMLSISCDHPDLEDFIEIKSDVNRITKANISIRITDKFMTAVQLRKPFTLSFTRMETGETITKEVDAYSLFHKMCEMNWDYAEPGMLFWDRIENWNLLSCDDNFHYAGTNPCAEEPLPAGGSCLLGSINLSEFVTKNKTFNFEEFKRTVNISVRALNNVLDEGLSLHPLKEQRESVRDWRQIGLGIMGLADMLIKMNVRYGSEESIDICDAIGYAMAYQSIKTSNELAKKYGTYPLYNDVAVKESAFLSTHTDEISINEIEKTGLYNSQLLTIAPTGSLSSMLGISGGIEPIYANYYERKTESLHGHDQYYKVYTPIVKKYMDKHNIENDKELPNFFVTAQTLDYKERIDMQAIWQKHIDASISSTVNVPNDFTVEQVEDLYLRAWKKGLKGVTIFRDGCKRVGILTTDSTIKNSENSNENTSTNKDKIERGMIIKADDNCVGKKRTLHTGCGTLHCEAFFDPDTGDLLETYFSKGSSGGCNNFMIGLSRMISLSARGGVDIYSIVDQLKSSGTCPSYAVRRATKKDTSAGSSCPVAIGNALIDMYEEFHRELFDDDDDKQDLKTVVKESDIKKVKNNESNSKTVKCPECGGDLVFEGGCNSCKNCGYSKCD